MATISELITPREHFELKKAALSEHDRKAVDRFILFLSRNPKPTLDGSVVLHKDDYDYALGKE